MTSARRGLAAGGCTINSPDQSHMHAHTYAHTHTHTHTDRHVASAVYYNITFD